MPIPPVALKRRNHRLLLCAAPRKNDLLAKLAAEHAGKRIAVAVFGNADAVVVPEGAVLLAGDTPADDAARFDLLVCFDLPADPTHYLARLASADDTALTLFDAAQQERLLGIEALLGRAIVQERPEGFAPEAPAEPKRKPKAKPARSGERPAAKRPPRENADKNAKPAAPRKPKGSGVSRFVGLDENGKPMFSGKTGERNHRKDGKPHTEESLAAKKVWDDRRKKEGDAPKKKKPSFKGDKKPYAAEKAPGAGGKKPYEAKKSASQDKPAKSTGLKRPVRRLKADAYKPTEPKTPKE